MISYILRVWKWYNGGERSLLSLPFFLLEWSPAQIHWILLLFYVCAAGLCFYLWLEKMPVLHGLAGTTIHSKQFQSWGGSGLVTLECHREEINQVCSSSSPSIHPTHINAFVSGAYMCAYLIVLKPDIPGSFDWGRFRRRFQHRTSTVKKQIK